MKIKLLSVIYLSLLCWNLSLARERNLAPNELGLNAITKTSSDVKVSKKQKNNVMSIINNVNRYWQSHHSPEVRSFWDDAAYHTGNIEVFKLTGNNKQLDYSRRWANYNHWKGATEPDTSK